MKKKILRMTAILAMCGLMGLTGCKAGNTAGSTDASKVLVFTIADKEVYLDEVNYYAFAMLQGMGVPEGTDMSAYYSKDYPTLDDAYKAQLITKIQQSKVLYYQAVEQGVTLTKDEQEDIEYRVDEFIDSFGEETLSAYGMDRELLITIYTEIETGSKLETQIEASVVMEPVTYGTTMNIVIPRVELDENGGVLMDNAGDYVYLSEAKQEQQRQLAEEILLRIQEGEDMEDLIEEYDLTATSGTMHNTTDSLQEAYGLQNGEVSEVLEDDFSYSIVKMIRLEDADYTSKVNDYNNSSAIQTTLDEQKNAWFNAYPVTEEDIEQEVWEEFTFQDFL